MKSLFKCCYCGHLVLSEKTYYDGNIYCSKCFREVSAIVLTALNRELFDD